MLLCLTILLSLTVQLGVGSSSGAQVEESETRSLDTSSSDIFDQSKISSEDYYPYEHDAVLSMIHSSYNQFRDLFEMCENGQHTLDDCYSMKTVMLSLALEKKMPPSTIRSVIEDVITSPQKATKKQLEQLYEIGSARYFTCNPQNNEQLVDMSTLPQHWKEDRDIKSWVQYLRQVKESDCEWLEKSPKERNEDAIIQNQGCDDIFKRWTVQDLATTFNSMRGALFDEEKLDMCPPDELKSMQVFVEAASCEHVDCALKLMSEINSVDVFFAAQAAIQTQFRDLLKKLDDIAINSLTPELEKKADELSSDLEELGPMHISFDSKNKPYVTAFNMIPLWPSKDPDDLEERSYVVSLDHDFEERMSTPCEKLVNAAVEIEGKGPEYEIDKLLDLFPAKTKVGNMLQRMRYCDLKLSENKTHPFVHLDVVGMSQRLKQQAQLMFESITGSF